MNLEKYSDNWESLSKKCSALYNNLMLFAGVPSMKDFHPKEPQEILL